MVEIIIIEVIYITQYLANKGEHTVLYKIVSAYKISHRTSKQIYKHNIFLSCTHACTRMHARIHTHTYTYTHTHTHTHTHIHTLSHSDTRAHTRTHARG